MIFIDEIDAVGYKRASNNMFGSNRESETTLNQLLNEMDGFEGNDKVVVVAATNLISNIDAALSRPGRFDRKIEIKLPTGHDRFQILKIHLKGKHHMLVEKDLSKAATKLNGFSGADIEALINQAALSAVK